MPYAIRLADTPIGQYVVTVEECGWNQGRRLIVTDDPAQARRWADPTAARRFWSDSGLPADVAFEIDLLPEVGTEVCDFCSASGPVWLYPAHQFTVAAYAWGSGGGWAACATCADLIEHAGWAALAERAVDTNPRLCAGISVDSGTHALAIETARQLHALFRRARTDAPRRPLRPA